MAEEVKALSFNILYGGHEYGSFERVADVIRNSGATVVMIQEPHKRGWWQVRKAERDGDANVQQIAKLVGNDWRSWVRSPQIGLAAVLAALAALAWRARLLAPRAPHRHNS
jgi:hypothetical protein